MIWQNPWAWLGLAAVALPVIIHLFGRGHARVHRFPSLRFIAASRLLPTRRTRLNDLALLLVRASMLAIAAAALARPLILTSRRSAAANAMLARVVIVDSTTRDARSKADSVLRDATANTSIATADVSAALPGAIAWLATQPMRGEIAIVSRFPVDLLDSADVASIPGQIGLRFVRVAGSPAPLELHARSGDGETMTRIAVSQDRTDAEWSTATNSHAAPNIEVLAGSNERRSADAARLAAASMPVALPMDSAAIAVVEPGYEGRAGLLASTSTPRRPWMMNVLRRVADDQSLAEAARRTRVVALSDTEHTLVVARADSGRPLVVAGQRTVDGREQLLFYSLADAGSLASAALFAAINQSTSRMSSARSFEPSTISNATLAAWQRSPSNVRTGSPTNNDESDGRWLWGLVIVLLGVETWLRREGRSSAAAYEIAHDRAA